MRSIFLEANKETTAGIIVPNTQIKHRLGFSSEAVHCLSEKFLVNKVKHFLFSSSSEALDPQSTKPKAYLDVEQ